ncbi:MAG TPA: hypothetical protein VKP30_22320 [Polyangiaceae bacterium]|nr:hypothetical protein [Polyangiaceae bacterium]
MKSQSKLLGYSSLAFAASVAVLLSSSAAVAQAQTPTASAPAPAQQPAAAPITQPATGAAAAALEAAPAPANVAATATETSPAATPPPSVTAAAPTTEAAPTTGTETAASVEETEAAQAQAEEAAASQVSDDLKDETGKINLYGFTDFTYSHVFSDRRQLNVPPAWYPSFYIGNFNLYIGSDLGKGWRTLSEVRFTYLPDGAMVYDYATNNNTRTSTVTQDYSDYGRNVKVGGIVIERAWLEYAAHPLLTIRGGQWLTPYGIWNVEHGTTVIVGTTRPYVIGAELFPQRQTGLEFYGSYGFSSTQVGYHLTLSNGRGPIDAYRDLDKNKAVGWRLWAQQDTDFGTFTIGTSGYKGRYTDRKQITSITNGSLLYDYPVQQEYRELSLALDAKWTWKGALVQGEAIVRDMAYADGGRPPPQVPTGTSWQPDYRTMGFYALGGYRLPWLGVMPYFGGEYYYQSKTIFFPDALAIWGGFNVRPTDRIVLKLQGTHSMYPTDWLDGMKKSKSLNHLIAQAAWSF